MQSTEISVNDGNEDWRLMNDCVAQWPV